MNEGDRVRKLRLRKRRVTQLTRDQGNRVVGGANPPASPWTTIIETTVELTVAVSQYYCTDLLSCTDCVTDGYTCSDPVACGGGTTDPVTACACLPSDTPQNC